MNGPYFHGIHPPKTVLYLYTTAHRMSPSNLRNETSSEQNHMHYLHLLILIASMACVRIVRRLIPPCAPTAATPMGLDDDIIGWLNVLTNGSDHAAITAYAKAF